jgi:hypothetical protein
MTHQASEPVGRLPRRVRTCVVVLAAVLWSRGGVVIAGSQAETLAPACSACRGGWAQFDALRAGSRIIRYRVPELTATGGGLSSEPTVITVTIDPKGRVCDAVLSRGRASRNTRSIIAAMREWEFGTWRRARSSAPVCVRTRFYIYIRREAGRMFVVIPGVTDRPGGPPVAAKGGAR